MREAWVKAVSRAAGADLHRGNSCGVQSGTCSERSMSTDLALKEKRTATGTLVAGGIYDGPSELFPMVPDN